MRAPVQQVPIILLTGFLGSGKTTLLSRWIRAPEFDGAMVIVNELGEVGLDHRLVESSSDVPLLLENGCACCAASEDLVATLERLFWDRLHRRIPRFTWVLIETTGIADPAPILALLRGHSLVSERYRVEGVVTAFDVLSGAERLKSFPECRSQIENADVILITKADLVDSSRIADARAQARDFAPKAQILESAYGELSAGRLLDALNGASHRAACGPARDGHDHDHHDHRLGDDQHDVGASHAHGVHTEGVTTAFAPLPQPVPFQTLVRALNQLMDRYKGAILRLKGAVRVAEMSGYQAIQAMPGEGIMRTPLGDGAGRELRTGLTIIAHGEPAALLAAALVQHVRDFMAVEAGAASGPGE